MQPGFFDLEDRYTKLDQLGDPLPKLAEVVDWEGFRPVLEQGAPEDAQEQGRTQAV